MFTGIITGTGKIVEKTENTLIFDVPKNTELIIGASIAVNGTCLTAVSIENQRISTNILEDTWNRTNLGTLSPGDLVNIEKPAKIGSTLDGHIVQGHVDGIGTISKITEGPLGHVIEVTVPETLTKYMVEKGSVTVDGISLTITTISDTAFTFETIPHTWEITNLHSKDIGDKLNIEVDVLAKYVEKLLGSSTPGV